PAPRQLADARFQLRERDVDSAREVSLVPFGLGAHVEHDRRILARQFRRQAGWGEPFAAAQQLGPIAPGLSALGQEPADAVEADPTQAHGGFALATRRSDEDQLALVGDQCSYPAGV